MTPQIIDHGFKKRKISFEVEATKSGLQSLIRRLDGFLTTQTNWNYQNLKSEIIK